jgi:hypothetical protein
MASLPSRIVPLQSLSDRRHSNVTRVWRLLAPRCSVLTSPKIESRVRSRYFVRLA